MLRLFVQTIVVKLSPVEAAFYQRQLKGCQTAVDELLSAWSQGSQLGGSDASSMVVDVDADGAAAHVDGAAAVVVDSPKSLSTALSKDETSRVLNALLRVRQSCCHPQVCV